MERSRRLKNLGRYILKNWIRVKLRITSKIAPFKITGNRISAIYSRFAREYWTQFEFIPGIIIQFSEMCDKFIPEQLSP